MCQGLGDMKMAYLKEASTSEERFSLTKKVTRLIPVERVVLFHIRICGYAGMRIRDGSVVSSLIYYGAELFQS